MHPDVLRSRALRLKWHVAALRFEIAMLRHAQVLRRAQMLRKAGFRPDQARDELGRWVEEGRGAEENADDQNEFTEDFSAQSRSRGQGHHFVPRQLGREYPFSEEAMDVFESSKTGPLQAEIHRWSKEHDIYSRTVGEKLEDFLRSNKIEPQQMTRAQAKEFTDQIKQSTDPRIRDFNLKIYRKEVLFWLRRIYRSPE